MRSVSSRAPANLDEALSAAASELSFRVAQQGSMGVADLLLGIAASARNSSSPLSQEINLKASALLLDMVSWYSSLPSGSSLAALSPSLVMPE